MRRVALVLAVLALFNLVEGCVDAYQHRNAADPYMAVVGLGTGALLALAAVRVWVSAERRPDELATDTPLPAPAWWWPVAATGLIVLLAGALVNVLLAIGGAALMVVALVGAGLAHRRPHRQPDRRTVRAARALRRFAGRSSDHPDGAAVVLEHIGQGRIRAVVVRGDGRYGDAVLPDLDRAQQAAALGGLPIVDEFDRELAARVRTGEYEWKRMAGPQLGGKL